MDAVDAGPFGAGAVVHGHDLPVVHEPGHPVVRLTVLVLDVDELGLVLGIDSVEGLQREVGRVGAIPGLALESALGRTGQQGRIGGCD